MKMLLTRAGPGTRIVVTGDLDQADGASHPFADDAGGGGGGGGKGRRRAAPDGLHDLVARLGRRGGGAAAARRSMALAVLDEGDVQRSAAVRDILALYGGGGGGGGTLRLRR